MTWNSSDAWLLQSIMQSTIRNPTADLAAIISVGDYINHSIFSWEEFNLGMKKLVLAKYVKENNGKISLTVFFHKTYKSLGKAPKSMNKGYEFVLQLLQTNTVIGNEKKVALSIDKKIFDEAIEKYLRKT